MLVAPVVMIACTPPSTSARMARSPRVIALEEISVARSSSADDLIRRHRPLLLLPRQSRTGSALHEVTPLVYVNGVRVGGIDVLQLIPATTLLRVEYLTGSQADSRFYGVHPGGVLSLVTRTPWRRW
jgi:hypothetical protein